MPRPFDRRALLRCGLLMCLPLAAPRAQACEILLDGMRITHPYTLATPPGARTAVLCMTFDQVTAPDRLLAVETPVADGAEMGGPQPGMPVDFAIPVGGETLLTPRGTHLRLTGLKHALEPGREYALSLQFEKAGTVFGRLTVEFPRFG